MRLKWCEMSRCVTKCHGKDGEWSVTGKFEHNIDAKGRVIVPSSLREELGEVCYVTLSIDSCLSVYSEKAWEAFRAKVDSLPAAESRKMRVVFANTARCELDVQGRILVPQKLREFVGISKKVTIIGFSNHAEIWDSEKYAAIEAEELSLDNIADAWKELRI